MSNISMNYQLLGRSGLRVSDLCLGTMTFGEDWGWGSAKDESRKIYDAFREAGGNFIDTANVYTNGTSEQLLGEFMAGHRDEVVLATKYTNAVPGNDANAGGNQRKNMCKSVEASLKRLKTDYIDLYWLHIWDQITPAEEVMRAFDDLVRAGQGPLRRRLRHAGLGGRQVQHAGRTAGWTRFVGLQIEYSLIERTVERELIPMAKDQQMTVLAWSPLRNGVLTGKYLPENVKQSEAEGCADAQRDDEGIRRGPREHAVSCAGGCRGGRGTRGLGGAGCAGVAPVSSGSGDSDHRGAQTFPDRG